MLQGNLTPEMKDENMVAVSIPDNEGDTVRAFICEDGFINLSVTDKEDKILAAAELKPKDAIDFALAIISIANNANELVEEYDYI